MNNGLTKSEVEGVVFFTPEQFRNAGGVNAAFSTKIGGVSGGCYAAMNLGFKRGDSTGNVIENYRRFCAAAGFQVESLVFNTQVHGTELIKLTNKVQTMGLTMAPPKDADGFITNVPGITLTCFYADCVPIFLYDPQERAIAAVHAGWRGTVADIAGTAVNALVTEYGCVPSNILACIGPSLCTEHFEVGDEVAGKFQEKFGERFSRISSESRKKVHIDLWHANELLLKDAGISDEHITIASLCTFCKEDLFYSHRKSGDARGNHTAFITLT